MRRDRQAFMIAGFASAAALTLGAFAGSGTTYAAFSDFAVISGEAGAGVWESETPPETELHSICNITVGQFKSYEVIRLTDGNDKHAIGNQKQIVLGYGGDDQITGDSRDKDNAPDCLLGGPGDDLLDGGNGPGVLNGGEGHDTCIGGPAATFVNCEEVQRTENSKASTMEELLQPTLADSVDAETLAVEETDPSGDDAPADAATPPVSEAPALEAPPQTAADTEPSDVESIAPEEPIQSADPADDAPASSTGEPEIPAE